MRTLKIESRCEECGRRSVVIIPYGPGDAAPRTGQIVDAIRRTMAALTPHDPTHLHYSHWFPGITGRHAGSPRAKWHGPLVMQPPSPTAAAIFNRW